MIIRNLEKKYFVIKELVSQSNNNFGIQEYLCRNNDSDKEKTYKITRQKLIQVEGIQIKFLMEQVKNETFSDFIDYFTDVNYLYIMMRYEKEKTLQEKISSESCSLTERLFIGKGILEKLLILNMPTYFLEAAMDTTTIFVSDANEITFDYNLIKIHKFYEITPAQGALKFSKVLKFLFKEEMNLKAIKEMEEFLNRMNHGEEIVLEELFKSYYEIYKQYKNLKEIELKPANTQHKLWEFNKKVLTFLKKMLTAVIVLAAFAYLFISIKTFMEEPEVKENFTHIGSIELEND